ncbi:hypothetical protein ACFX13_022150 [Malus domestica]
MLLTGQRFLQRSLLMDLVSCTSSLERVQNTGPWRMSTLPSSILPNMTSDLNLGVVDLLQRSFKSSVRSVT